MTTDHILRTFDANQHGRDFAIGDLHGSYSSLVNLLSNLNFDPTVDRLFSCGDLCDRGPDSYSCLSLLRETFFHSIRANHEELLLEAVDGAPFMLVRNGGAWAIELLSDSHAGIKTEQALDFIDLVKLVRNLPLVMTVSLRDGSKVHLIHAELPIEGVTDEMLADQQCITELNSDTFACQDGGFLQWGRRVFNNFYRADLSDREKVVRTLKYLCANGSTMSQFQPKPTHSPVICGHTPVQRPMTVGSYTNIDTMAYGSYDGERKWPALTAIDLNAWKFYQATETTFKEVEPFVVTREEMLA